MVCGGWPTGSSYHKLKPIELNVTISRVGGDAECIFTFVIGGRTDTLTPSKGPSADEFTVPVSRRVCA